MNQRPYPRIALLAGASALLFLLVACAPLLVFAPVYLAAPDFVYRPLFALWSVYISPLSLFPKGSLDSALLVPSRNPVIQFGPQLVLLWFFWSLVFFGVLAMLSKVRRAA